MSYLTEKNIVVLIGVCGFLWLPADAYSEEPLLGSVLPSQEILPLLDFPTTDVLGEGPLVSILEQETPLEDSFRFPNGEDVSNQVMQTRFFLGERIGPQIVKPETTFRMSAKGGFGTYLNQKRQRAEIVPIDPEVLLEQQLAMGVEAAETTVEFFDSTAIPLVGSLVSGVIEVGQGLQKVDRRLKRHHLHLWYSDGRPTASYRIKY